MKRIEKKTVLITIASVITIIVIALICKNTFGFIGMWTKDVNKFNEKGNSLYIHQFSIGGGYTLYKISIENNTDEVIQSREVIEKGTYSVTRVKGTNEKVITVDSGDITRRFLYEYSLSTFKGAQYYRLDSELGEYGLVYTNKENNWIQAKSFSAEILDFRGRTFTDAIFNATDYSGQNTSKVTFIESYYSRNLPELTVLRKGEDKRDDDSINLSLTCYGYEIPKNTKFEFTKEKGEVIVTNGKIVCYYNKADYENHKHGVKLKIGDKVKVGYGHHQWYLSEE